MAKDDERAAGRVSALGVTATVTVGL